jgi:hypothetical protein
MSKFYRTTDGTVHDLTAERFAQMQANGKARILRQLAVDPQPSFDLATHALDDGGVVVGPTEARQTWKVRALTAEELERSEVLAEQVDTLVDDVNARLAVGTTAFNALNAVQKMEALREDRRVVLRALRYLLRRARRNV